MNVSQYRHQVQFPPKMAICCLPFHGLADSVDKGFREAGHRWHPRFDKVILLGDSEGQLLLLLLLITDDDLRSCYDAENMSSYISPIQSLLHIIEILKLIETFYHWCLFMQLGEWNAWNSLFAPKNMAGLQEAKKRGRSRIESVCYRVCLLL